jgi:hypothetical protein
MTAFALQPVKSGAFRWLVMPSLVPGIRVEWKDVDGRDNPAMTENVSFSAGRNV